MISTAVSFIGTAFEAAGNVISPALDAILSMVESVMGAIAPVVSDAWSMISSAFESAGSFLLSASQAIGSGYWMAKRLFCSDFRSDFSLHSVSMGGNKTSVYKCRKLDKSGGRYYRPCFTNFVEWGTVSI